MRIRTILVGLAFVISAVACDRERAGAQVLTGKIVDISTGQAIATASIAVFELKGERIGEMLTDSAGRFLIPLPRPGKYRVESTRLGYQTRSDTIAFNANQVVTVTFPLAVNAITLEPITIVERSREFHDATVDGLYVRRALSPAVGGNRVFVKGDLQFDGAWQASELLRLAAPRSSSADCWIRDRRTGGVQYLGTVFWNGNVSRMAGNAKAVLIETSTKNLEGVEIYTDITTVPLDYRMQMGGGSIRSNCGVVALWTRRPDYPKK